MNKKKSVFKQLVGSYIGFSFLILISFVVMSIFWYYSGSLKVGVKDKQIGGFDIVDEKGVINEDTVVNKLGGWIEKLDEDNNIIEIIGDKQDKQDKYTSNEIMDILNHFKRDNEFDSLAVRNSGTNFIIKLPKGILDLYASKPMTVNIDGIGLAVFLGLYSISIFFISRRLSKKIKKPIDKMLVGMNRVKEGEKGVQIDFHTNNELKDNFNDMVVKLEVEENRRLREEENKNRLLLDLSHDIKTPLSTIKSYSIALKDGLVEEEKKFEYYDILDKKSSRISYLVDEMTNMLKLENSDYIVKKDRFNFTETIRQCISEYYCELESKGLEIRVIIPEKDIFVEGDSNLIKRVINNLIENQIKYNEGSFVEFSIFKDKKTIFKVSDNGKLIENNIQNNLFNPFIRGDEARSSTGGLGLGLSIAKTIVNKHNGEIYYSNKDGLNNFIIELNDKSI